MKVYILTNSPYHDNDWYFGAYSTEEKARTALAEFKGSFKPDTIAWIEMDQPAICDAATLVRNTFSS